MEYEVVYETNYGIGPMYLGLMWQGPPMHGTGAGAFVGVWTNLRERGEMFDSPAQARHAIERYVRADMRHHAKVRRVEDEHGDR